MPALTDVLRELPKARATRLAGGLGLRYSEGRGLCVLACSRVGAPPSAVEMKTVAAAVVEVFAPEVLFGDLHIDLVEAAGVEHQVQRLYWPRRDAQVVWMKAMQKPLLG